MKHLVAMVNCQSRQRCNSNGTKSYFNTENKIQVLKKMYFIGFRKFYVNLRFVPAILTQNICSNISLKKINLFFAQYFNISALFFIIRIQGIYFGIGVNIHGLVEYFHLTTSFFVILIYCIYFWLSVIF
jgi:hypothetical protein